MLVAHMRQLRSTACRANKEFLLVFRLRRGGALRAVVAASGRLFCRAVARPSCESARPTLLAAGEQPAEGHNRTAGAPPIADKAVPSSPNATPYTLPYNFGKCRFESGLGARYCGSVDNLGPAKSEERSGFLDRRGGVRHLCQNNMALPVHPR